MLSQLSLRGPLRAQPGEPLRRRLLWTSTAVALLVAGSAFSFKLDGRFAVSNVFQLVALLIMLVHWGAQVRLRDVIWMLTGLAGIGVGALALSTAGRTILPQNTVFFACTALVLLCFYRAGQAIDIREAMKRGARWSLLPLLVFFTALTFNDRVVRGRFFAILTFDDKSHAGIACILMAFLALWAARSYWRLLLSFGFVIISLLTFSRVPVLALPFFLLAFVVAYRQIRRNVKGPLGVYVCHLTLVVAVLVPLYIASQMADTFLVFDRVDDVGSDSTQAHIELIRLAVELNFSNPWYAVFGVTPGGFGNALAVSNIDLSAIASLDPNAFTAILRGTAPVHSTHAAMLVEFPIWIFALYIVMAVWLLVRLARVGEWILMWMWAALLVGSTFYSSHNEVYYLWALAIALGAASSGSIREQTLSKSGLTARQDIGRTGGDAPSRR